MVFGCVVCQELLTDYRALLLEYRALLTDYKALLVDYRALYQSAEHFPYHSVWLCCLSRAFDRL